MENQNVSKSERKGLWIEPDCLTVILLTILSCVTIWAFFDLAGLVVYLGISVTVLFIITRLK